MIGALRIRTKRLRFEKAEACIVAETRRAIVRPSVRTNHSRSSYHQRRMLLPSAPPLLLSETDVLSRYGLSQAQELSGDF